MSLIKGAQRMQQAQRPKQILRSLLESLYPDKVHLSELTQQLVNSIPLLTEHDQVLLISSPIDFLITFKPQILDLPIRILLEQLHAEGKLEKQVKSIIDDENITLTEQQQALMEKNLVDFLIGVPPESDPIVELHLSEQDKLHNTIFNAINNILINKSLDDVFDTTLTPQEMVEKVYKDYLREHSISLGSDTEKYLLDSIVGEFVGFGLLEPLLNDPSISEVRVMGLYDISIIRNGKQEKVSMYFEDLDHLWRIITRFTAPMDMNVTEREPFKQFRMPNNNIVTVVHSSIVYHGPFLTIIKPV